MNSGRIVVPVTKSNRRPNFDLEKPLSLSKEGGLERQEAALGNQRARWVVKRRT